VTEKMKFTKTLKKKLTNQVIWNIIDYVAEENGPVV